MSKMKNLPAVGFELFRTQDGEKVNKALDCPSWCSKICIVSQNGKRVWWVDPNEVLTEQAWITKKISEKKEKKDG